MVRTHPQWLETRRLITSGRIGSLRSITCFFSYLNPDPENIRNQLELGGGALMDIGCYPITISRFIFDAEPRRVIASIERDSVFGTDSLTTAVLDFAQGHSTFTCSTRLAPYQRMMFLGTQMLFEGRRGDPSPFSIGLSYAPEEYVKHRVNRELKDYPLGELCTLLNREKNAGTPFEILTPKKDQSSFGIDLWSNASFVDKGNRNSVCN